MSTTFRAQSLADLRRIPLGTRLRLVHNLRGPCDCLRTVAKVQRDGIAFERDEAPDKPWSWLTLPAANELRFEPNGFAIVQGGYLLARYEYVDDAAAPARESAS